MYGAAVGAVIGDWLGPVVGNALRAEMRDRLGAVASMVIEVGMLRQHRYVAWGQAQQARKTSFSFALQTRIRSLRNVQFASTCALQTRYAGCKEKKKEKEKVRLLASVQRDAKYHTGLPRQAGCKQCTQFCGLFADRNQLMSITNMSLTCSVSEPTCLQGGLTKQQAGAQLPYVLKYDIHMHACMHA